MLSARCLPDDRASSLAPAPPLPGADRLLLMLPHVEAPDHVPAVPGFDIEGELGRGGWGVVYRAHQKHLNRTVALKMILAGGHAGSEERVRFLSEAEVIASLHHPGIVQVHEFGTCDGLPWFALEYCPGGSLANKLNGTPLPPREAAALVEQIARAVQAAHDKGIIHRDLKPANVNLFFSSKQPCVTDFGLARRLERGSGWTQDGAVSGNALVHGSRAGTGKEGGWGGGGRVFVGGDPL